MRCSSLVLGRVFPRRPQLAQVEEEIGVGNDDVGVGDRRDRARLLGCIRPSQLVKLAFGALAFSSGLLPPLFAADAASFASSGHSEDG